MTQCKILNVQLLAITQYLFLLMASDHVTMIKDKDMDKHKKIKILYAGCGLAGCHSSLRIIGNLAQPRFDPLQNSPSGWQFLWRTDRIFYIHAVTSNFGHLGTYSNLTDLMTDSKMQGDIPLLKAIDCLIVVVDSQSCRQWHSQQLLSGIKHCLSLLGRELNCLPVVFQLNKRDLPEIETTEELMRTHTWPNCDYVETIANNGNGVVESLNRLIQLVEKVKAIDLSVQKSD